MRKVLNLFQSNKMLTEKQFVAELVDSALAEDEDATIRTLFYSRDVRGGEGYRKFFREAMSHLATTHKDMVCNLIEKVPEYGRFDDLIFIKGDPDVERKCLSVFAREINKGNVLAAKWCPRESSSNNDKKFFAKRLRNYMKKDAKSFRKLVSALCANADVPEQKMSANDWESIAIEKMPSKCLSRNMNALTRHVPKNVEAFMESIKKGEVKLKTTTLSPVDIYVQRDVVDKDQVNMFWQELENYIPEGVTVVPMIDTSGSMNTKVANTNYSCMDVAVSFGTYVATKSSGLWKNTFLTYSERSKLEFVPNNSNIVNVLEHIATSHWGFSTNLESAVDSMLEYMKSGNATSEDVPDYIIIFSDMQLNGNIKIEDSPALVRGMFASSGYDKFPIIVNWNIGGSEMPKADVGHGYMNVTGFAPNTLSTILTSPEDISPLGHMKRVIYSERYDNLV